MLTIERWQELYRQHVQSNPAWEALHYFDLLTNMPVEKIEHLIADGEGIVLFFDLHLATDHSVARLAHAVRQMIVLPPQTDYEVAVLRAFTQYQNLRADLSILHAEYARRQARERMSS